MKMDLTWEDGGIQNVNADLSWGKIEHGILVNIVER